MNKNKFFSPSRFYALLRSDLLINYKKYLLTVTSAGIVIFLYISFKMYDLIHINYTYGIKCYAEAMGIFLIGLGALIGLSFPDMSSKAKTCNYLMIPASTFEKFASQFIIRYLLSIIVFVLLFWIGAYLAQYYISHTDKFILTCYYTIENFEYTKLYDALDGNIKAVLTISIILSIGLYLYTARLFFIKYALLKSIVMFSVLMFIAVLISYSLRSGFPAKKIEQIEMPCELLVFGFIKIRIWAILVISILGMALLPLGYFKLKEKQL